MPEKPLSLRQYSLSRALLLTALREWLKYPARVWVFLPEQWAKYRRKQLAVMAEWVDKLTAYYGPSNGGTNA